MITGYANVQECLNGYGYGAEKVDGKYLVNVSFQSCELADTASYTAMLQNLETTAIAAIMRLEAAKR
jgi:hypothetical protein